MILGIDEAGRGPWAGPLVVGAVVLGGAEIEGLTDSKKLTKKRREALLPIIKEKAVAYATGWVSADELDAIGMSAALQLATIRAVRQITVPYTEIIIDGTINFLQHTKKGSYVKTMPKADLLVPSVSAASVLAKVERDTYMAQLDEMYGVYGFSSHAGYGTAKHRAAIDAHGVIPEHRVSFAPLRQYVDTLGRTVVDGGDAALARQLLAEAIGQPSLAADKESAGVAKELGVNDSDGAIAQRNTSIKTTKQIGDAGEARVARELEQRGHTIIARNWRTRYCEIDIISTKDNTLYFTEVKTRKNAHFGDGLAAITAKKQQQMRFAAELFMVKHRQYSKYDMDLLAASVIDGVDCEIISAT